MTTNVIWLGATPQERLRYAKRAQGRNVHAGDALQMLVFVGSFVAVFAAFMLLF